MDQFWPALKPNAVIAGRVYGIPFQNSTPLLYYNAAAFKEAGLDPDHPPATWADWIAAAKALIKIEGGQTQRWGLMFPATYDYCGWIVSGLTMSNGGQYFNHDYGGEAYYNAPSTLGALSLLDAMVNRLKVTPPGVSDANACTSAFFAGHTGMMVLSTGSLSFVRDNMKTPYRVAVMPAQCAQRRADWRRLADPAQGQFSRAPSRRLNVDQLADEPRDRRRVESLYGIFRTAQGRPRSPRDEGIFAAAPRCEGGARPAGIRRPLVRHLQHRCRAQVD
jgi:hypothetical protein